MARYARQFSIAGEEGLRWQDAVAAVVDEAALGHSEREVLERGQRKVQRHEQAPKTCAWRLRTRIVRRDKGEEGCEAAPAVVHVDRA